MAATQIRFKAVPINNGIIEGGRLVPKGVKKITPGQFIALCAKEGKTTEALVRYYSDIFHTTLERLLTNNCRVDTGHATFYIIAKGSVPTLNAEVTTKTNPLKLVATVNRDTQKKMQQLEIVNETLTVDLHLFEIVETGHTELNELFTANAEVLINTNYGTIVQTRADEGVWLVDANGETVATAAVVASQPGYSLVRFPTLPEPGEYTLVYTCRNGEDEETYTPATRKRKVTVVGE